MASSNDGQLFYIEKTTFCSIFANNSVFILHFMKVSTENDNNFWYEKIMIVVDNIPSRESRNTIICKLYDEETIFISAFNAENFMKIR